MTAHAVKGYKEKCLAARMDDYIAKPLKKKDLITMVEKWTGGDTGNTAASQFIDKVPDIHPQKTPGPAEQPFDFAKVMDEFENDREFLFEVLNRFIRTVSEQLPEIEAALAANNFRVIQQKAHAIKGGAGNLTAAKVADAAARLENNSKNKDIARSAGQFDILKIAVGQLATFANRLQEKDIPATRG